MAGVRKGCVAAFGVADTEVGTERLVVVAETRETEPTARERLRETVHQHIADALGIPPDTVVLTRPGSVLKTSSGKVRRGATKDAYLDGSLDRGTGSMVTQWLTLGAQAISARCAQAISVVLRLGYNGIHSGARACRVAAVVGTGAHESSHDDGAAMADSILPVRGRGVRLPTRRHRTGAPA